MFTYAGYGRPGYYMIAYDEGANPRMLACFTPSGKGVCFSNTGKIIRYTFVYSFFLPWDEEQQ